MTRQELQLIFAYNEWANRQVLTAAAKVSQEQYQAPTDDSYGSLQGTLVHIFAAEYGWRMLCQHGTLAFDLDPTLLPTVALLAQRWTEEATAMHAYIAGLADGALTGLVRYTTDTGIHRERVLWHCLWHVVNHGTQHRGEAATLLTRDGQSPGELDFTVFLNATPSPK